MENFPHRGDVKASRKSEQFIPIVPLTPQDLAPSRPEDVDFSGLLANVRQLRAEIGAELKPAAPSTDEKKLPSPLSE
jgi:hypothetical protein